MNFTMHENVLTELRRSVHRTPHERMCHPTMNVMWTNGKDCSYLDPDLLHSTPRSPQHPQRFLVPPSGLLNRRDVVRSLECSPLCAPLSDTVCPLNAPLGFLSPLNVRNCGDWDVLEPVLRIPLRNTPLHQTPRKPIAVYVLE